MTAALSLEKDVLPSSNPRSRLISLDLRDVLAITYFVALTVALLVWAARTPLRLINGDWPTQWFPFYAFLGERLRAGVLPGWNPHQFSGMPFAANPSSGWAYWPAMLCYTLFPAEAATVAFIGLHLLLAGIGTYLLARVLALSIAGGLVAGTIFLAVWTLLSIDQFPFIAVLTAWLPLALLGIEVALRAARPFGRLGGWAAAGVAVSQMLGTWLGQGAYYGLLFFAAWLAFRTLIVPPYPLSLSRRVLTLLGHGAAMTLIGLALAAAGLLPRLEFNPLTNVPSGHYDDALAVVEDEVTWAPDVAVLHVTGGLNGSRMVAGAAAVGLALLSLIVARRWFAMPFFAAAVAVTYVLALDGLTPLHTLFFTLVPLFEAIHLHRSTRILMLAGLPISLLAGAAISYLWHASSAEPRHEAATSGRNPIAAVVGALLALGAVALLLTQPPDQALLRLPLLSLAAVGVVVAIAALVPSPAMTFIVPAMAVGIILWQPVAQLRGRELGPDPSRWGTLYRSVGRDVPDFLYANPAAAFLRSAGPSWRYIGYDPALLPPPEAGINAYRNSASEPGQAWLLVDNWATWFDLNSTQGYNPILVRRYVEVVNAVNGHRQEYHGTNIFPDGIDSPLLDLLSIRHVVIPADPPRRSGLAPLTETTSVVYADDHVQILERDTALPRAWLVHEVRQVSSGEAVALLADGVVDPARAVVLETPPPPLAPAVPEAVEEVVWLRADPDLLELAVTASSPALLVLSDVWDPGWQATVDGAPAPVSIANHAFRAVAVPAGQHTVRLEYAPRSLWLGTAITALTGSALVIGLISVRRR